MVWRLAVIVAVAGLCMTGQVAQASRVRGVPLPDNVSVAAAPDSSTLADRLAEAGPHKSQEDSAELQSSTFSAVTPAIAEASRAADATS